MSRACARGALWPARVGAQPGPHLAAMHPERAPELCPTPQHRGSRREHKRELRSAMCSMNQLPLHSEVPNPAEEQGPETGSQLS